MDRISDERIADMIAVGKTWAGSFAKDLVTAAKDLVTALTELRERRVEIQQMIDLAGEAIGTDPALRTPACVKVLADHVEYLRKELRERRAAEKGPQRTTQEQWCGKEE
jgi:hypothetical protein